MSAVDQALVLTRSTIAKALAPLHRRRYTLDAYHRARGQLDTLLADEARRVGRAGDDAYPGHLELRRSIAIQAATVLDLYVRTPAAAAAHPRAGQDLRAIVSVHQAAVDDTDHEVHLEDVAYAIGIAVAADPERDDMTELGGRCLGGHKTRQRRAIRRYHDLTRRLTLAESATDPGAPRRRRRLARQLVGLIRDVSLLTGGVPVATAEHAARVHLAHLIATDRAAGAAIPTHGAADLAEI